MMKRRGVAAALVGALLCLAGGGRGFAQQPVTGPARWEAEIRKFEEADRRQSPPKGGVVFVGSSSIRMWKTLPQDFPGVDVLNRGFGGSEMEDSAYFAERIVTPYSPRLAVVYAGDNDLQKGKPPERVLADYKLLVSRIREKLPETRVAFISIKPSLARWKLVDRVRAANDLIREFAAKDPRQTYIDVFTPMLGADGTPRKELFVADGLHLNAEGYAVWKTAVAPVLK
jgi:lysophospholipase L1-like esterase